VGKKKGVRNHRKETLESEKNLMKGKIKARYFSAPILNPRMTLLEERE